MLHQEQSPHLLAILDQARRRVGGSVIDDDIESQGSDSEDSVYLPQELPSANRPTVPTQHPLPTPSRPIDATLQTSPILDPGRRAQGHRPIRGVPRLVRGAEGDHNLNLLHVGHMREQDVRITGMAESPTVLLGNSNLPIDMAEIQGAAALLDLNHPANTPGTGPAIARAIETEISRNIRSADAPAQTTPHEEFIRALYSRIYGQNVGPTNRNQDSHHYPRSQYVSGPGGYVASRTGNIRAFGGFQSENQHLQQRWVGDGVSEARGPASTLQHSTASLVSPPLRFQTNTLARYGPSIGLVRAPLGSSSRIGTSQWQVAASNQVPECTITGTPADRNLDVFFLPNADGTFPDDNRPRPSATSTRPPNPMSSNSRANWPPEYNTSELQMGHDDEEDTEENNEQNVTVIKDDQSDRAAPTTTRRSAIKWPQDVGIPDKYISYSSQQLTGVG